MPYQASYPDSADDTDAGAGAEATTTDDMEKPEGESDGDGQRDAGPDDEEDSGEQSALIPKGLLAGKHFEPGEEVVFEIVKMRGDEVEIKYAKEKPGDGDSEYGKADKRLAMMGAD